MENVIIVIVLLAIVTGIVWYLLRAKKSGQKCIGCPYSKQCKSNCDCGKNKTSNINGAIKNNSTKKCDGV